MKKGETTPLLMSIESRLLRSTGTKISYCGTSCSLVLNPNGLTILDDNDNTIRELFIDNVLGAKFTNEGFLEIYNYDVVVSTLSCCSGKLRQREVVRLLFNDNGQGRKWANAITVLASSRESISPSTFKNSEEGTHRCRRFLVFVNPASGQGGALSIWENNVKPMLEEAAVEAKLVVTEHINHAYNYMKDLEYSNYESVMTIGGDGLIHEVINGISSRPDSEVVLRSLPLAPIPGGSGNGLAKSVTFESGEDHSVTNSVFVAVKGKPAPLDLSFVQTATRTFLSFLLLGWGLISDVDILSESLRWMGEIRLYIAALYFVIARRIYRGRVSLYTGKGLQPQAGSHPSYVNRPESLPPFENEIAAGNGWEVIDSSFVLVWIVQTSHCTTQAYSGPGVTMDDGLFTVYVVDDSVSRFGMLQLLLNIDSGGHINHPDVKTFKCTAYRLEPFTTEGLFTLDGEQVEYGPIQGVLRPGAARVLACIDR